MKKSLILFLLLASSLFISSCKDDEPAQTPKTRTQLLSASPWKLSAAAINPGLNIGGTIITDFYSQIDACKKDDLVKYESNKTGVYDDGATKCEASDPQSIPFIWTFDLSETKITENGESFDILQLNEITYKSSIVYDGSEIGGTSGINYTLTQTFTH